MAFFKSSDRYDETLIKLNWEQEREKGMFLYFYWNCFKEYEDPDFIDQIIYQILLLILHDDNFDELKDSIEKQTQLWFSNVTVYNVQTWGTSTLDFQNKEIWPTKPRPKNFLQFHVLDLLIMINLDNCRITNSSIKIVEKPILTRELFLGNFEAFFERWFDPYEGWHYSCPDYKKVFF